MNRKLTYDEVKRKRDRASDRKSLRRRMKVRQKQYLEELALLEKKKAENGS